MNLWESAYKDRMYMPHVFYVGSTDVSTLVTMTPVTKLDCQVMQRSGRIFIIPLWRLPATHPPQFYIPDF